MAIIQDGSEISRERARRNLDFLLAQGISSIGLFKSTMSEAGEWKGDARNGGDEAWCIREEQTETTALSHTLSLVRRQGDCLLFALRQL